MNGTILFYLLFFITPVFAQLTADFSPDVGSGCTPLIVQFTDNSTGNPTAWFWDLGNGTVSTAQNPATFYMIPGAYTISLVVINDSDSDTLVKPFLIKAFSPPVAKFFSPDTLGCVPHTVNFSDLSLSQSAPVENWFWNFGDGTSSTLQNPTHTYNAFNNYTVYLTVKDANGCQSSFAAIQYVKLFQPDAEFDFPAAVCPIPATVNFTNTSVGAGLNSLWDFGDGGSDTTGNPSHTYLTAGTFYVKLIVTGSIGCTDSITNDLTTLTLQADFNYSVACFNPYFLMQFTDQSVPAADSWQWDFGDGFTSDIQNPTKGFFNDGQPDTIRLITGIGQICFDTIVKTYQPVTASFFADSFYCQSPFTVNFSNASTGMQPLDYLWEFSNGSSDTIPNPSHVYSFPYSVVYDTLFLMLQVSDTFGCVDTVTDTIAYLRPYAKFGASPASGCIPLPVQFLDSSISSDTIVNYLWNFGNGNFSSLPDPSFTYTDTGTYSVTLSITTQSGCTDSVTDTVRSGIKPDFIDFTDYDSLCFHNLYQWYDFSGFNDTSTHVNNWLWYFGWRPTYNACICSSPGDSTTAQNPFFDTGHWPIGYDTILFIAGYNGCNDSTLKMPFTTYPATKINHHGDTAFGYCAGSIPVTLNLSNSSAGYTFAADFFMFNLQTGDTTVLNPDSSVINAITINNAGQYQFNLTTFNDTSIITHADTSLDPGCYDSNPHFLLIVDSVNNGFTASPKIFCMTDDTTGSTISFTDTSLSMFGEIIQWLWIFGDGNSLINDTIEYNYFYETGDYILHGYDSVSPEIISDSVLFPSKNNNGNTGGTFRNPTHTYHAPGTYIVSQTITVILPTWCCGSLRYDTIWCNYTFTDTVFIDTIVAKISMDYNTSYCPGDTIDFYDISYSSPSPVTQWIWTYGDGSPPDTIQNPAHIYADTGNYTTALIVKNADGCTSAITDNAPGIINPQAYFTPFLPEVCLGVADSFINKSEAANNASFFWNFGDGDSAALYSPAHLYNDTGFYIVTLTATSFDNVCSDTYSDVVHVTTFSGAGFKSNDTLSNCPPLPVVFTDTSTSAITSWNWDFGDGQTSTLQNPAHLYTASGNYTVSLTITDTGGCTGTIVKNDFIIIDGPTGTFEFSPVHACFPPLPVDLFANALNTVYFIWNFGDGTVVSDNDSVAYIYSSDGSFLPELILMDSTGCTFTITGGEKISINNPSANFSMGDTLRCRLDTVFFLNMSTAFNPMNYFWNFGNGDTSIDAKPSYFYDSSGTYFITLTSTDSFGCTSSFTKKIMVNKAPALILMPSDTAGCIPFLINFSASRNDTSVKINSWTWDLGDGAAFPDSFITHTYTVQGNYNAQLTVLYADSACEKDTAVMIDAQANPVTLFSMGDTLRCRLDTIFFLNLSTAFKPLNYFWNFGNGDTSIDAKPSYFYDSSGTYFITLTSTDSFGCTSSFTKKIMVNKAPALILMPSDTAGCIPFLINFSASRNDTSVKINSWTWDLGDGAAFPDSFITHTYTVQGNYNAQLTVIYADSACRKDTAVKVDVKNMSIADFTYTPASPLLQNEPVQFTNQSSDAVQWQWTFGDGNKSWIESPQYIYKHPGMFTIMLIASDACSDSITKNIEIVSVIPNIITPNGDGFNDAFIIEWAQKIHIEIFNRWGELVYEKTGKEIQWYGRTFAGADVPDGTYFYTMKTNDETGLPVIQKGNIMVVR